MVECDIKFENNPFGIYFAGQTVNGQVVLTLQKQKKVRGICLKIAGMAHCEWTERHSTGVGKSRRTRTIRYTGREDYLASTTYLVGSDTGISLHIHGYAECIWSEEETESNDKGKAINTFFNYEEYINTVTYLVPGSDAQQTVILPGIHTYSFSCTLPSQLPSSFEGGNGYIRYTVRVALERPWKFDQTYKVAFTVLKQLDLNYDSPALRIASQGELVKTFCCGPCKSAPMLIRASIPQTGYVPGQVIVVSADIKNDSNVEIDELRYTIRKIVHYTSQSPCVKSIEEITDVCEQRRPGLESKSAGSFKQEIQIPAVPPSLTTLCRVIQISYEMKLEVKVEGAHINPIIRMPFTVGTVPLADVVMIPPPSLPMATISVSQAHQVIGLLPPTPEALSQQPITAPLSAQMHHTEMPPPSYEETVGEVNITEEDDIHPIGFKPYAPRYPVYDFNNNPR